MPLPEMAGSYFLIIINYTLTKFLHFYQFSTPLHLAVQAENEHLIRVLLADSKTDCERQDQNGFVPLWYALQNSTVYHHLNIN